MKYKERTVSLMWKTIIETFLLKYKEIRFFSLSLRANLLQRFRIFLLKSGQIFFLKNRYILIQFSYVPLHRDTFKPPPINDIKDICSKSFPGCILFISQTEQNNKDSTVVYLIGMQIKATSDSPKKISQLLSSELQNYKKRQHPFNKQLVCHFLKFHRSWDTVINYIRWQSLASETKIQSFSKEKVQDIVTGRYKTKEVKTYFNTNEKKSNSIGDSGTVIKYSPLREDNFVIGYETKLQKLLLCYQPLGLLDTRKSEFLYRKLLNYEKWEDVIADGVLSGFTYASYFTTREFFIDLQVTKTRPSLEKRLQLYLLSKAKKKLPEIRPYTSLELTDRPEMRHIIVWLLENVGCERAINKQNLCVLCLCPEHKSLFLEKIQDWLSLYNLSDKWYDFSKSTMSEDLWYIDMTILLSIIREKVEQKEWSTAEIRSYEEVEISALKIPEYFVNVQVTRRLLDLLQGTEITCERFGHTSIKKKRNIPILMFSQKYPPHTNSEEQREIDPYLSISRYNPDNPYSDIESNRLAKTVLEHLQGNDPLALK